MKILIFKSFFEMLSTWDCFGVNVLWLMCLLPAKMSNYFDVLLFPCCSASSVAAAAAAAAAAIDECHTDCAGVLLSL